MTLRGLLAWLEPPRRIRPTRAGTFFLLGIFAVGFAAINTGNNLLYFVLGMGLASIVVSGILSERVLRGIEVERSVPAEIRAREAATFAFVVRRAPGGLPALALAVRDRDGGGPEAIVPRVDPGRSRRCAYVRRFERRGVYALAEVEAATVFPFGLFRKSRWLESPSTVRVRPFVPELDAADELRGREEGEAPRPVRGEGSDLFGVRPLLPGDDARRIHWKASARAGRPMVKETAREEPPSVVLRLRERDPEAFEAAVERAAGLCAALIREGYRVGLADGTTLLRPASGAAGLDAVLDHLVDVRPGADEAVELPADAAVVDVTAALASAVEFGGRR